jgi:hypothetical protein
MTSKPATDNIGSKLDCDHAPEHRRGCESKRPRPGTKIYQRGFGAKSEALDQRNIR